MRKAVLFLTVATLLPVAAASQSGDTTFIQNGTLLTVTNGNIDNGDVDMVNAAIGNSASCP